MRYLGIKFVLKNSTFLQLVEEEKFVHEIIERWMAGTLKPVIGNDTRTPYGNLIWAINTSDISMAHSFDAEDMRRAMLQQTNQSVTPMSTQRPPFLGLSGI